MPAWLSETRSILVLSTILVVLSSTACTQVKPVRVVVEPASPRVFDYEVTGSLTKRLVLTVDIPENYATLSVYAGDTLLVDNLNVPRAGSFQSLLTWSSMNQAASPSVAIKAT